MLGKGKKKKMTTVPKRSQEAHTYTTMNIGSHIHTKAHVYTHTYI